MLTRASGPENVFETPRLDPGSSVWSRSGYSSPDVVTPPAGPPSARSVTISPVSPSSTRSVRITCTSASPTSASSSTCS